MAQDWVHPQKKMILGFPGWEFPTNQTKDQVLDCQAQETHQSITVGPRYRNG